MKKFASLPLLIAIILLAVAGVAFYLALVGVQEEENVMTAGSDLAAYSYATKDDLVATPVPRASISEDDLTEEEYDNTYLDEEGNDVGVVLTAPLLTGQKVDQREVAEEQFASFGVVLPDERVVAATTTVAGGALGTVRAGDVVDVSSDSGALGTGEGGSSDFAKVLCITASASGCQGVLPPGSTITSDDGDSAATTEGGVQLLLATASSDAQAVAGKSVVLSLNPFCKVNREGYFVAAREDVACEVSADRLAAQGSEEGTTESTTTEEN